ncbi:MAG: hypothetical protein SAJ12_16565 [Jaaginema sp. PMC 1079.18]|nr:hypothetical protein [Jaaginema sp. PMC 1080.18]MEC4852599.1 hypothetical protein [Jaaginema sp. PMC 1079.18]MEC4868735.1 hypothetical protein [Jaaginema sp. PMC 1078.18]
MENRDRIAKQPYSQPQLKVYGDIKTLTASVATGGNIDGGGGVPNRTN